MNQNKKVLGRTGIIIQLLKLTKNKAALQGLGPRYST